METSEIIWQPILGVGDLRPILDDPSHYPSSFLLVHDIRTNNLQWVHTHFHGRICFLDFLRACPSQICIPWGEILGSRQPICNCLPLCYERYPPCLPLRLAQNCIPLDRALLYPLPFYDIPYSESYSGVLRWRIHFRLVNWVLSIWADALFHTLRTVKFHLPQKSHQVAHASPLQRRWCWLWSYHCILGLAVRCLYPIRKRQKNLLFLGESYQKDWLRKYSNQV